jgi:hypothetical protein
MRTSGARDLWLGAIAGAIMDGGANPPSIDRLALMIPDRVGTSINDGHVTAAIVFGEDRRKDFAAGQRFIIEEMVQLLVDHKLVEVGDNGIRWVAPLDGEWRFEVDGRTMVVYGQRERRMSRDRSLLGERSEETGEPIGPVGLFSSGNSVPFDLEVLGPRGGHEAMKFQVHPIAAMIPPMTETERETLRASIARDGVKVPLVIFQKKILDGRHRGYYASILKKPVEIKEFTGTEEEAKRHVAILNLHRRHLSTAQRAAIAEKMFGAEAKKEAAKAKIATVGRPGKLRGKSPSISETREERKWEGIAAQKANEIGLNTSADAIKLMSTVALAPQTSAAVERGEIKTVATAHTKALAELRRPAARVVATIDSLSVNRRLGRCVTELQAILKDTESEDPTGTVPEINGKLDRIEQLLPKVRYALRQRNIIR